MPHDHNHSSHDHSHEHTHAAGHDHGHVHAPASYNKVFAIAVTLNLAFVGIEAFYGYLAHSLSLMADAGHNLSDVLGLLLAWAASAFAKSRPSRDYTYGLRGSSILAALANAIFLLVTVGALTWEAIGRLAHPDEVVGQTMMIVAAIGIFINGGTALLFMSGHKEDLNLHGAFLHMAADALVSVGVVIGGALILYTGWMWLDPVISVLVNAVIVVGTWRLLTRSLKLALGGVPDHLDTAKIELHLRGLPEVMAVHDLHIWAISTTEVALTCHLVTPQGHPGDDFLHATAANLQKSFGIHHATFQIETHEHPHPCALC